jgi:hypothetical protein
LSTCNYDILILNLICLTYSRYERVFTHANSRKLEGVAIITVPDIVSRRKAQELSGRVVSGGGTLYVGGGRLPPPKLSTNSPIPRGGHQMHNRGQSSAGAGRGALRYNQDHKNSRADQHDRW